MFNGNFMSIIHHFQDIEVFLLAGNDVIAISPLGGALKRIIFVDSERATPTFYSCCLDFFVYLEPFTSYSTLLIWLGFQHQGVIWG